MMGVVVFFVLLIACANLANLARARLVGRRQDLAVRQAMGASRLQLVRPLVSESLVLGVIGGSAGLVLAMSGLRIINAIAFEEFFKTLQIDRYVLFFNGALSVITPLMFSLWPAFSQSRAANSETRPLQRLRNQPLTVCCGRESTGLRPSTDGRYTSSIERCFPISLICSPIRDRSLLSWNS